MKYIHKVSGYTAETENPSELRIYKICDEKGIPCFPLRADMIENSNDWEKVVEKDYEILSFKSGSKESIKNENGLFNYFVPTNVWWTEKQMINDGNDICSVKRLIDGEVFTVGDYCIEGEIGCFEIDSKWTSGIAACFTPNKGDKTSLDGLEKKKEPLFTTEDGVEYTDPSRRYYYPYEDHICASSQIKDNAKGIFATQGIKRFSKKEAAEAYIEKEKKDKVIETLILKYVNGYHNDEIGKEQMRARGALSELYDTLTREKLTSVKK